MNRYAVFVKAVECGSFTRAARELNYTQSAVSQMVRTLEEELSATLVVRSKGGVRLTADGEVLDGEYLFGAVCNSTSIGGLMKLDSERVVLDDGKFEMLLIPNPKTPADLQNLVLALLNQQYDSQGLVFRHVSSIHVETAEQIPWSLDGEYAPAVPEIDITTHQKALRMLL